MLDLIIEYRYVIAAIVLVIGLFSILFITKKDDKKNISNEEKNKELDIVLKAIEENTNRKEMSFEEEQEENAIISYQELLAAANGQKKEKIEDNDQELADLINKIQLENHEIIETENDEEIKENLPQATKDLENQKKFKNSEFISPVFGKDKPKESNDEFLQSLKNFRSNL